MSCLTFELPFVESNLTLTFYYFIGRPEAIACLFIFNFLHVSDIKAKKLPILFFANKMDLRDSLSSVKVRKCDLCAQFTLSVTLYLSHYFTNMYTGRFLKITAITNDLFISYCLLSRPPFPSYILVNMHLYTSVVE